ncbi:MAG: hypothetical protein UW69_C0036G0007 [Microgenomates group bacterium GW2011_GWA2_44_7]|nr:MAG: hypothetical protein UW69_C0036G0007 [Microgenomates group bacterium GW2011_GWA2_44_7]
MLKTLAPYFKRLGFYKRPETDFEYLNRKWSIKHRRLRHQINKRHRKALNWLKENIQSDQLALGSLGGLMLLAIPGMGEFVPKLAADNTGLVTNKSSRKTVFQAAILDELPKVASPLSAQQKSSISELLTKAYGFKVTVEIDQKELNTNYGWIGAEQHLYRFPGDNLSKHFESEDQKKLYERSGIAPGLGAWRYFADSKDIMLSHRPFLLRGIQVESENIRISLNTGKSWFSTHRTTRQWWEILVIQGRHHGQVSNLVVLRK